MTIMDLLLDIFFPKTCLGCNKFGAYICEECLNTIQPISKPVCPVCYKGSVYGLTHHRCKNRTNLVGLSCGFPYYGLQRRAITKLKYKFISDLNQTLVDLLVSLPSLKELEDQDWLVAPIPLHPKRKKWRGFNQSHYLAQSIASYAHWEYREDLLLRTKHTTPQMNLSGDLRRKNLVDAFSIHPKYDLDKLVKPILLVDDVFTTGATLHEAAKVLPGKKVWALTIARRI